MKTLTKTALLIFLIIGTVIILYYGRNFLLPLAFGGFFAMLFTPMENWLQKKGIPKTGAVMICLLTVLAVIGIFFGLIAWQGNSLAEDWPKIKEELNQSGEDLEDWAIANIGIVSAEQVQQIKENLANQKKQYMSWIQSYLGSFLNTLLHGLLAIVYMVFLMLASERLHQFAMKIAPGGKKDETQSVLNEAEDIVSSFFVGRLMLVGIQGVLYAIGFSIFGLQYAIPVGLLAGLLTFIPYMGNIIGGLLALFIGLATGGGSTIIFGIIGTMTVVQLLENYVLTPWIVGSEVSLNPFFTFICVIAFSLVWGVGGTVLAVPITAIIKTIFDHIPDLRPYGYVMGLRDAKT
ncbi:AI-2E family transporter [Flavilitoribacter nigricans]|uniref:AI-2E family transporter n=1 Tax=Flavilitoribacter nigricans TaxID=70997 RepID=UPI0014730A53|nr:AI-2E family transporter [Flavilitoribacter nigricans]